MGDSQCILPPNTRCTTFLTRGQSVGISVTAESGLISATAVVILFCLILKNVWREVTRPLGGGWRFFRSPLDVYMLSLFVSDLVQGIGFAFDTRWVALGTVQCGSYCTAQGVMQQLGETSVAMATLAIAVHTFVIILFRRGSQAMLVATLVVSAIWLYVILFVAIGVAMHNKGDDVFDTPTPYWCWIGAKFTGERIAGEYFWFWFTALASLVLYVLLFYCIRGNIETEDVRWWRIHFRRRIPVRHQHSGGAAKAAFIMLLYPVFYVALILPLSTVRWIGFINELRHPPDPDNLHQSIPSAENFAVQSIFGLSGLVNVILFLLTRRGLLHMGEVPQPPPPGPVFGSSASVASSTRDLDLRLRAMELELNMGELDGFQRSRRTSGEA